MHFADALTKRAQYTSPLSVGIDPVMSCFPEGIPQTIDGARTFCRGIIDAVAGIAACVKLQLACYELFRGEGMHLFWEIAAYAKERGLIVIADGKRNDIASTAELYAEAYLGKGSPIDALTVNPYLGADSIQPFIERCVQHNKGIFVLVKTSNPGSVDLQDLPVGDVPLHEHLAELVQSWGMSHRGEKSHLSCIGAVVGATYPEELRSLRSLMPNVPFLIPGYGAQDGTLEGIRHGFLLGGTGAIVHATRSVVYTSHGEDWREKIALAAQHIADSFKIISPSTASPPLPAVVHPTMCSVLSHRSSEEPPPLPHHRAHRGEDGE